MTPGTVFVLLLVLLGAGLALWAVLRGKTGGCGGCTGDCRHCKEHRR